MPETPGLRTGIVATRARSRSRTGTCVNRSRSRASRRRGTGLLSRDEVDEPSRHDDRLQNFGAPQELGDALVGARAGLVLGFARTGWHLHASAHLAVHLHRDLDLVDDKVRGVGLRELLVRERFGVAEARPHLLAEAWR